MTAPAPTPRRRSRATPGEDVTDGEFLAFIVACLGFIFGRFVIGDRITNDWAHITGGYAIAIQWVSAAFGAVLFLAIYRAIAHHRHGTDWDAPGRWHWGTVVALAAIISVLALFAGGVIPPISTWFSSSSTSSSAASSGTLKPYVVRYEVTSNGNIGKPLTGSSATDKWNDLKARYPSDPATLAIDARALGIPGYAGLITDSQLQQKIAYLAEPNHEAAWQELVKQVDAKANELQGQKSLSGEHSIVVATSNGATKVPTLKTVTVSGTTQVLVFKVAGGKLVYLDIPSGGSQRTQVIPTAPQVAPLGQAGPGECVPGNKLLAQAQQQKPGGLTFKTPYTAKELAVLKTDWISWVTANESQPCVAAMAQSAGVSTTDFPAWLQSYAYMHVVGASGLTVKNTYFAGTRKGEVVNWMVQTFPVNELVFVSKNGTPLFKYACGNVLRPVPVVVIPQSPPSPPVSPPPPRHHHRPKPPTCQYGGKYPNCNKPPTCQYGGKYPNCNKPPTCQYGGIYPNCNRPPHCVPNQYNNWCKPPTCVPNQYNNWCKPQPCPQYQTGMQPYCHPIPCGQGYSGNQPNCQPPPCQTGWSQTSNGCQPPPKCTCTTTEQVTPPVHSNGTVPVTATQQTAGAPNTPTVTAVVTYNNQPNGNQPGAQATSPTSSGNNSGSTNGSSPTGTSNTGGQTTVNTAASGNNAAANSGQGTPAGTATVAPPS